MSSSSMVSSTRMTAVDSRPLKRSTVSTHKVLLESADVLLVSRHGMVVKPLAYALASPVTHENDNESSRHLRRSSTTVWDGGMLQTHVLIRQRKEREGGTLLARYRGAVGSRPSY